MLYRRSPQGLRLGIDLEADALISNSGVHAYQIAHRRAEESSGQQIAKDWSRVAATIARKTGTRPATLAAIFLQIADQVSDPVARREGHVLTNPGSWFSAGGSSPVRQAQ
jgi:hypothetical protein